MSVIILVVHIFLAQVHNAPETVAKAPILGATASIDSNVEKNVGDTVGARGM